ncbi:Aste57867_2290 [Aphanomyces stellatus]|uniref:Aste57867_2290 protein n=1 Tax=Aphanomyces stellatus TaxID=120398 RepID=A0A485KAZ7_9STRA|nr:hypothetical protein As57867_002285 [Aphanomyces stellatus]VFT79493.1 Aste57867_2290 [Aphanomyces stellatus]
MSDMVGFAWMWVTALVCLVLCAYFILKKKPAEPLAPVYVAQEVFVAQEVYVAQPVYEEVNTPAKIV